MERLEERFNNHAYINKKMAVYFQTDNKNNKNLIMREVYEVIFKEAKKLKNDYRDWEDAFHTSFVNCLEKFDPSAGYDFMAYFTKAYFNEMLKGKEKIQDIESLEESYLSDDDSCRDKSEGEAISNFENSKKIENLIDCMDILCDSIISIIKKNENSPKKCYPKYFFTEQVTKLVSEDERLFKSFSEKSLKYLYALDDKFIKHYSDKGYDGSFNSLQTMTLKCLSDFTHKEKDKNMLCGYALKNCVFSSFLNVTDGAVSQKKKEYDNITHQIYIDNI